MASLFEYRRMLRPGRLDSRWGYVRLVLSPTARAIPLYHRAGFVPAGGQDGELLLARPAPPAH